MRMKKVLAAALCLVLALGIAACGSEGGSSANVEGTLTDLMAKIYENAGVEVPMLHETPLDDDNKAYMLGSADVPFTEGLASEAAIMTIPHSMVLIRVDAATDIEATKQLIRDNANPGKWICAWVEPDQVIVDNIGDLIFLVMSRDAEAYHQSFLALAE